MRRAIVIIGAAAAAMGAAVPAQAAPSRVLSRVLKRPDVAVTRVAVPRAAVAGQPFTVVVSLRERSRRAAASATVSVNGTAAAPVRVNAGGGTRVSVPVTLPLAGTIKLPVTVAVPRDRSPRDNRMTATVTVADFAVTLTAITPAFAGFGAQFNHHEYAQISRDAGVADDNVADMEAKVTALQPQFARLFFNRSAFTDPDRMQSFVRAAQLAQRTGATIDVTWQTNFGSNPDVEMPQFANVLTDLLLNRGVTNLRWASVQNEVNSTKITMDQYDYMVRLVDAQLRQNGVRDRILLMGGDLVSTQQGPWLQYLAAHDSDVLDGFGIHVYWDYWTPAKIERRLQEVRTIWDALPVAQRKPLYVTEFGARGHRAANDGGPGFWDDAVTPLELTNQSAFQHAWFAMTAARLGYVAAIKWDAYFGRYDNTPQAYSMIGPPQEGWPLRPSYNAMHLLTAATRAGWSVLDVGGASGTKRVTAFGGGGALTVFGLDSAGAALNATSPAVTTYRISGLPPSTRFSLLLWNADGTGTIAPAVPVTTDAAGTATVGAPQQAVFALTTLPQT